MDIKTRWAMPLALLAGLTIGAGLTTALKAQSTPPAYIVAQVTVHDPDSFMKEYAPKVAGTLESYGGHILTSGKLTPLEGDAPPRVTIIAFDSVEKARGWYESPAYQQLATIRHAAATSSLFIAEGRPSPLGK